MLKQLEKPFLVAVVLALLFSATAAGAAPLRGEAELRLGRRDVPGPAEEARVTAMAVCEGINRWVVDRSDVPATSRRRVTAALEQADLDTLRGLMNGPERVTRMPRRTGYIAVGLEFELNEFAFQGFIDGLDGDHPLKGKRVMVVIPEFHIRRRIPDPAGETEIKRMLQREGFRIVDQAQTEVVEAREAAIRGDKAGRDELVAIANRLGADVLITGEAFSEEIANRGPIAVCRARIEIKVILTDTAEDIASDDGHATGEDRASSVAHKKAIREAATACANKLLQRLLVEGAGQQALDRVRIVLTNATFEGQVDFEDLLAEVEGVGEDIEEISFLEGRAEIEVVTQDDAKTLAKKVFRLARKKGFKLKVIEQSGRRLVIDLPATAG